MKGASQNNHWLCAPIEKQFENDTNPKSTFRLLDLRYGNPLVEGFISGMGNADGVGLGWAIWLRRLFQLTPYLQNLGIVLRMFINSSILISRNQHDQPHTTEYRL
ncbi:hypothetical protein Bca4012_066015 [Brassica carinata]